MMSRDRISLHRVTSVHKVMKLRSTWIVPHDIIIIVIIIIIIIIIY